MVSLFIEDFKAACVTVHDGQDLEGQQEQAQYLWTDVALHYGQTIGEMWDEVDKYTTACIGLKCLTFVSGCEEDVKHGLVSKGIYDRHGPSWKGRAKGQKKYLANMVPVNVRNSIASDAKKYAERGELTVVVVIELISKLGFMGSLPAGSVTEDTLWTSDDMVVYADPAALIAQLVNEEAVRKNSAKSKLNARQQVVASMNPGAAGVGGLSVDKQGGKAKPTGKGKRGLPQEVQQDWTGREDDVTRCLVPGHGGGKGGHVMRNCPLTVNQAGTYNIVGCAPTTGQVVSRVTLQKSMVELRTYAQRQVVREELLNAPMRGGVRYYKGTLQSLLAKWKVAEPAAKGGAAVGAVVQQQVGGAVGQQKTQYQQQPGYPAGKGMGKGKGQMQQPGYTGGQGMGNGKGMQPIPPQANDRSVNWGGQQGGTGPPSMVGSVQTGPRGQYGGAAPATPPWGTQMQTQVARPQEDGTYGQQWGQGQQGGPAGAYAQVSERPWGAWGEQGQSVWGSTDGVSNAPEVDMGNGLDSSGKFGSMRTVMPVTAVDAESEEVIFALSPEERLVLLDGDRVNVGNEKYALVGGAMGAQATALTPLFQMSNIKVGTSWIIPCEMFRVSGDGKKNYKTFYIKVDTGAEVSGATPEGAEMISTFKCKAEINGGASAVRGIGNRLVPVTKAIFPMVVFQECGTGSRRVQTLQVVVMEGATDRTHQILLGLDNFTGLGGMPRYGEDGQVVGIYWSKIQCYSEVCTPASAARQFSW